MVRPWVMKCLPSHSVKLTAGAHPIIVTLITSDSFVTTQTCSLRGTAEHWSIPVLPLEAELMRRANEMGKVLDEIMERPISPGHWGLNE